jgi:hypothetical protein
VLRKIGRRDKTTNDKIPSDRIAIPESSQNFTFYSFFYLDTTNILIKTLPIMNLLITLINATLHMCFLIHCCKQSPLK